VNLTLRKHVLSGYARRCAERLCLSVKFTSSFEATPQIHCAKNEAQPQ
jgi:hypothetical protein